MPAVKKETLLRSKDVAHILDLPPDDVIYLARKGKLRGVKEGKYWKFRLRDVKYYQKKLQRDLPQRSLSPLPNLVGSLLFLGLRKKTETNSITPLFWLAPKDTLEPIENPTFFATKKLYLTREIPDIWCLILGSPALASWFVLTGGSPNRRECLL